MPGRLSQHHPDMATFDNPSYFTIAGQQQSPLPLALTTSLTEPIAGAKPKRFKNWFKLSSTGASKQKKNLASANHGCKPPCPSPEPSDGDGKQQQQQQQPQQQTGTEVVYYNFCPAPPVEEGLNDDVFASDTWTVPGTGSTRTLNHRRRHSLGSWFRSSLAAVRKNNNNAISIANGLERSTSAAGQGGEGRPSTSSERTLLPRNVSGSVNCVSYRSSREVRTPEPARSTNNNVTGDVKVRSSRSRLPIAVKSQVELRARARYARQAENNKEPDFTFGGKKAASTSRIPRAVQHHQQQLQQTASLDRRYTNSTEVLSSDHPLPATTPQAARSAAERPEAGNQFRAVNRASPCPSAGGGRKRSSGPSSCTPSRNHRLIQRSRTIEERHHRTSCCGRMAAAASSSSSRRRASLDATGSSVQPTRRRCQRCRDKAEASSTERVDVVIIFSRNCVVAAQWVTYLTELLNQLFLEVNRPATRITSRDVEGLVNCGGPGARPMQHTDGRAFERSDYQNEAAVELLEEERLSLERSVRRTVSMASLQIVLLTKSLLNHVGLHANDPLGGLLHPKRVLGLLMGLDEKKDISQLHISALYSFEYWPKVVMRDQDLNSVTEFRSLAYNILCRSKPIIHPETGPAQVARFKITPRKLRSGEERVTLILLETVDNIQSLASVHVGLESGKEPICVDKLRWLNPYTIVFNVPKEFLERGIIVKVQLKVSGTSWGVRELKCSSKLGELALLLGKNQLVGNQLDVMCQALNISPMDHETLDRMLAENLESKNIKGSIFKFPLPSGDESSEEEFPTLLHFAARFGFERLLWELLECPGAIRALHLRNCNKQNVIQIAETNGHLGVVSSMEIFMRKSLFEINPSAGNPNDYIHMNVSDAIHSPYDFVPKPKPYNPLGERADEEECDRLHGDYLMLLHDGGVEKEEGSGEASGGPPELRNPPSPKAPIERTPMDEMREILEEVKNGKLDPRQAEIFFDDWKKRKDVQQYVERREEILQLMSEAHPKKTEKKEGILKRLFALKSSPSPCSSYTALAQGGHAEQGKLAEPVTAPVTPLLTRHKDLLGRSSPYASWSGSDRSSVASRVSSHDSGTHSDSPEERKGVNIRNEFELPQSTETNLKMSNYVIPPPPRPVLEGSGDPLTVPISARLPGAKRVLPPIPLKVIHPFDVVEFSPPAASKRHGEDLGRILPNEEPDVMEQAPILFPSGVTPHLSPNLSASSPSRSQDDVESNYMIMTPKCARKSMSVPHDDDYMTIEEINLPSNRFVSGLRRDSPLSSSASQLPIIPQARKSEWRSDPSLSSIPPPVAPRHVFGVAPTTRLPSPAPRGKRSDPRHQ